MTVRNPLLEKMFAVRGYTPEFLSSMNQYDPNEELMNVDRFCKRLHAAKAAGIHIVFIPDFDMDGIMSGTTGFAGLAELGMNVSLFIPTPKDGYGFTGATIARIVAKYPDVGMIITADVGIRCFDGIAAAKMAGIEVLVTDHHMPGKTLPSADIIVDPLQPGETYSNPGICGACVIYQCLQQYADTYCNPQVSAQIRRLRVFAGIGTISDSMPLYYGNRSLVRDAISICRLVYSNGTDFVVRHMNGNEIYRRAFRGLRIILTLFAEAGKISSPSDINEEFFGYYLAPMFNSVKRIGDDMTRAFGVFFGSEMLDDANYLVALNEQRKALTTQYLDEISNQMNPMAPFVYIIDAPSGILGLLATRLMDITQGPCLVISWDGTKFHGSGRSPDWYPFLDRANGHFCSAAGHNPAFGVSIESPQDLDALCDFIEKDTADIRAGLNPDIFVVKPDFVIAHDGSGDSIIDIVLFMEFLEELGQYHPFGSGFDAPNILLKFKSGDGQWDVLGSAKQHLKITLEHGFKVLLWNQADKISMKDGTDECHVLGKLSVNEFHGNLSIQFIGEFI